MITETEYNLILEQCRSLPAVEGYRLVNDYMENLLLTVLDFQIEPQVLTQAMDYYQANRQKDIRELADLQKVLGRYTDSKRGNTAAARNLWNNNKYWTRTALLRRVAAYFEAEKIYSQAQLATWAQNTLFDDFRGKVSGMGYVLYQRLVMRQGIQSLKPDLHVLDFANSILGRFEPDSKEIIARLTAAAAQLGLKAYELDWRIWEHHMSVASDRQLEVRV